MGYTWYYRTERESVGGGKSEQWFSATTTAIVRITWELKKKKKEINNQKNAREVTQNN